MGVSASRTCHASSISNPFVSTDASRIAKAKNRRKMSMGYERESQEQKALSVFFCPDFYDLDKFSNSLKKEKRNKQKTKTKRKSTNTK
jgi:hypothetical protein